MRALSTALLVVGIVTTAFKPVFAVTVTLKAELVANTMCDSGTPDTNYEATNFSLTVSSTYSVFWYGRDYESATRFAALQWKLPLCPPGMRESAARLRIYGVANNRGALGFARLTDNPDLSALTWNSAISDGYIGGTGTLYRVSLGGKAVSLSETLSANLDPASWFTCDIPAVSRWLGGMVSMTESNTFTLITIPMSGNNGTVWRGGCLNAGNSAELEIDFVPISQPDAPVTNALLVALQPDGVMANGDGRVVVWRDNAPLGGWQDFVQSATSRCPVVVRSKMSDRRSRDVLDFTAANTHHLELAANAVMDTNTWSWFIVFKPSFIDSTRIILRSAYSGGGGGASAQLWGTFQSATASDILVSTRTSSGVIAYVSHLPPSTNTWFVSGGVWNGTGSAVNGQAAKSIGAQLRDYQNHDMGYSRSNNVTQANASPSGHLRTRIGVNSADLNDPFSGQIAEILIYKTVLSQDDHDLVMDYLYEKYFKPVGTLIRVF